MGVGVPLGILTVIIMFLVMNVVALPIALVETLTVKIRVNVVPVGKCWNSILTDIGGYIFGKVFKGPKLTKISPKKTYSGVIGSFILSVVGSLIFIEYFGNLKNSIYLNYISFEPYGINLNLFVLFFILISSLTSQLGDLIVSYFKRIAKIKDTGKILPGHGGLLDRIDGVVFNVPFVYLLLKFGGSVY